MHAHRHPHSTGTPNPLPSCGVLARVDGSCKGFLKVTLLLNLHPCRPRWCRIRVLLLEKRRSLGLRRSLSVACQRHGDSGTALRSLNPGMRTRYVLGSELPLYDIDHLPIKLTTSPSPRAGDTLPSERRISGSFCLKSSERFLKAQIYIL